LPKPSLPRHLLLITLALSLLAAACGPAPTPLPLPTRTPRPGVATPTGTFQVPSSKLTPTPSPTWNVKPETPSATPVPGKPTATPVPAKPTPTPGSGSQQGRMQSPEYGIQVFLWWQPETTDRDLQLARDAGFTWIKQNFSWIDIEGAKKGALDWNEADRIVEKAQEYGLDIVARVDKEPEWARNGASKGPVANYNDYGDFLFQMATRYRGRIRAYEVWNEPNKSEEWGGKQADAVEYVKMLKVAYQRIKQADPKAIVVSAGLAPTTAGAPHVPDDLFLKRMYVAGAKPYFDVLGAHGTGFKAPPETDPADIASGKLKQYCAWEKLEDCARVWCFRHVEDLRKIMVDNGDSAKQIMILEFGWDSDQRKIGQYEWHYVSEETKAEYIIRAFQYAQKNWAPWIGAMTLIYIADPRWTKDNEQYWWSITDPDGTPRPAYTRFKQWRQGQ